MEFPKFRFRVELQPANIEQENEWNLSDLQRTALITLQNHNWRNT